MCEIYLKIRVEKGSTVAKTPNVHLEVINNRYLPYPD